MRSGLESLITAEGHHFACGVDLNFLDKSQLSQPIQNDK